MLKFPRKEVGEQGKRNGKERKREEMKEGMERKGKDQGEKGNGIYLGLSERRRNLARRNKGA